MNYILYIIKELSEKAYDMINIAPYSMHIHVSTCVNACSLNLIFSATFVRLSKKYNNMYNIYIYIYTYIYIHMYFCFSIK